MFSRVLTLVVVALAIGLSGCSGGSTAGAQEQKGSTPAAAPRDVKVLAAAERTIARTVSATGTI